MAILPISDLKQLVQNTIYDNLDNEISGQDVQTAIINAIDTLDSLAGFVNVHKANGQTTITAYGSKAAARAAVPTDAHFEGVVIAYKLSTGWIIEQNLDTTAGTWADNASWQTIGPVSVLQNSQTGHTDLIIGNETIPVASVRDFDYLRTISIEQIINYSETLGGAGYQKVNVNLFNGFHYTFTNLGINCSLNLVRADGTEQGISNSIGSNQSVDFTCTEDYVGVRCYVAGTNFAFSIVVDNSYEERIEELETRTNDYLGKSTTKVSSQSSVLDGISHLIPSNKVKLSYCLVGNGAHSSEIDRIPLPIKKGNVLSVALTALTSAYQSALASISLYNDTTGDYESKGTALDGRTIILSPSFDVETLGIYFNNSGENTIRVDIEMIDTDISITLSDIQQIISQGVYMSYSKTIPSAGSVRFNVRLFKGRTYTFKNLSTQCTLNAVKLDGTEISLSSGIATNGTKTFVLDEDCYAIRCYVAGTDFSCSLTVDDNLYNNLINDIKDSTYFTNYDKRNISEKIKEYCQNFNTDGEVAAFMFFTDPHNYTRQFVSEDILHESMTILSKIYRYSPTDFALCGGDWFDADSQENARNILGDVDAISRTAFDNRFFTLFGNHDDNYQGWNDEEETPYTGRLTKQETINLLYRHFGHRYFSYKINGTRYIMFDSETDSYNDSLMSEYKWQQIDWFANLLLEDDELHNVLGIHIVCRTGTAEHWDENTTDFAKTITQLANAYNNKQSITLNDVTYNFANTNGTIHLMLCGHTHYDYNTTLNNIPIICTTNLHQSHIGEIAVDLVLLDYDGQNAYLTRIGRGNDRVIPIV